MAFKDIKVLMYNGTVEVDYRDKAHRYYVSHLQDGIWSKASLTRGVTTILDTTLEKKGLQTWPMNMALKELFGFYDFTNADGETLTGFSKGQGTLWDGENLRGLDKESAVAVVQSAAKNHTRRKKQGADIGSLVHDAIEQYLLGAPFEITVDRYREGQEFENMAEIRAWEDRAQDEVSMALLAYGRFTNWWETTKPQLLGAEFLVYSKEHDYAGACDGRFNISPEHHPVFKDWTRPIMVIEDHKTSKASVNANAPQGVYYSYFAQNAAYACAWYEMTGELVDDLLVVSARKDGGFDLIYASEVGLSVIDAIAWWKAIVLCHRNMTEIKKALKKRAP